MNAKLVLLSVFVCMLNLQDNKKNNYIIFSQLTNKSQWKWKFHRQGKCRKCNPKWTWIISIAFISVVDLLIPSVKKCLLSNITVIKLINKTKRDKTNGGNKSLKLFLQETEQILQ